MDSAALLKEMTPLSSLLESEPPGHIKGKDAQTDVQTDNDLEDGEKVSTTSVSGEPVLDSDSGAFDKEFFLMTAMNTTSYDVLHLLHI